ncbi:hypothetical protein D3C76_1719150 [compost metagenome]
MLTPELEKQSDVLKQLFSRFLALLAQLAFEELGLRRLCTETFEHRVLHIETLEASGFRYEGCLREHVLIDGRPTDSMVHGLLALEWNSAR